MRTDPSIFLWIAGMVGYFLRECAGKVTHCSSEHIAIVKNEECGKALPEMLRETQFLNDPAEFEF